MAAHEFQHDALRLPLTVSIGVAAVELSDDGDLLLSRADQALYTAKHSGRNRVSVHDGQLCQTIAAATGTAVEPTPGKTPIGLRFAAGFAIAWRK